MRRWLFCFQKSVALVLSRLLVSSSESFADSKLVVEEYNANPVKEQYAGSMGVFGLGSSIKVSSDRINIDSYLNIKETSSLMAQAHLGHGHGKQSYLAKRRERSNTIIRETDSVERLQFMTNFNNPILGGNVNQLASFNDTERINGSIYNSNLSVSHSSNNNSITNSTGHSNSTNNCNLSRSPIVPIPFLIDDRTFSVAGSYNSKDREKLFGLSLSPTDGIIRRGRSQSSEDTGRSELSDEYDIEGTDGDQSPFTIDE